MSTTWVIKKLTEIETDTTRELYVDVETDGLYGDICLVQLYQECWNEPILVTRPNPIELAVFLDLFHCILHNGHYDITCIQIASGTRWEPQKWDDTMYLAKLHFYGKDKFSLDKVMEYCLGYDPYEKEGLDKKELQKSKWSGILSSSQLIYAAIDVFCLPAVWNTVRHMTEDTSYELDKLILSYSLDFQNNGFAIDNKRIDKQFEVNEAAINECKLPINANSFKQVREYINSHESDALGLAKLAKLGSKRAADVNTVRKLVKQNSFLKKYALSGARIAGKFQPSARSGRFTCRDQNLQQIPRKLKGMFGLDPNEGRVLVYSDYPQIELRSITCIAGEHRMEKLFLEYKDLHTYTAEMLFGKGYTKDERQIAKTCNFALLYGAGWIVLQAILIKDADMWLEERDLRSIISKWKCLWSGIAAWQNAGIAAWRAGSAWSTPFGRRYKAERMTDQLNIKNQGFAAEIAKLAMHYAMSDMPDSSYLVNFVHDAFIYECDIDDHEEVARIISVAMQKAWFEALRVGDGLRIRDLPMPINTYVGYNWGAIESDFIHEFKLKGMESYEKFRT